MEVAQGATTLSIMTFSITTLSIMTLGIKGFFAIFSIMTFSIGTLSITTLCHHAEFRYSGCLILFIIILNVIMLSVVMLNVVILIVVLLQRNGKILATSSQGRGFESSYCKLESGKK